MRGGRARSPGPLVFAALPLLWVIASAGSKRHGLAWFLAGLGLLALGAWSFRRGARAVLYRIIFLVLLASGTVLGLEALLRVVPGVVRGSVANDLFSGYHVYAGGIYRRAEHMGAVLRPSVRRRIYWSGHWWWHETNADGYRGPALARADAVFLDDSMVYGHGIETGETVPARFGSITGLATANLGQQGTCLVQASMILRDKGLALRPRVVLVCSHPNDLTDATDLYAPGELRRFLTSSRADDERLAIRDPELWPRPWWDPFELWSQHLALPLRCSGILGSTVKAVRGGTLRLGGPAPAPVRSVPSGADLDASFGPATSQASEEDRLRWAVHRQAVARIKRDCDAIGARLVLFDLRTWVTRGPSRRRFEGLARDMGVVYNPAGRVALERVLAGEDLYLSEDGHWNAAGARRVAEALAASRRGTLRPSGARRRDHGLRRGEGTPRDIARLGLRVCHSR